MISAAVPCRGCRLLQLWKQKMTCHAVQHGDTHKKHTGADQIEDHITGGGHQWFSRISDHQKATGGQRTDFYKHISCEYVVGIA